MSGLRSSRQPSISQMTPAWSFPTPAPLGQSPSGIQSPLAIAMSDGQSPGDVASSGTVAVLNSLQDLLDALDTLPCIKYVAGIAVKILQTIDQMKTNERELQLIGVRARNFVVAVATACEGAGPNLNEQLQKDLTQLTDAMTEIQDYVQQLSTRSRYKKVFYKTQDATSVRLLDTQLMHAFQIFSIQSSVHIRVSQEQMFETFRKLPEPQPPSIKHRRLDIPEGLYLIRTSKGDSVIESEHIKSSPTLVHAYVAPYSSDSINPFQLWTIYSRRGLDFRYTIRNFATGAVLDLGEGERNHVTCWSSRGGDSQTWEFMGSRQSETTDYFYVRGCNSHTILDADCSSKGNCNYLHITEQSTELLKRQEWCLVRIPWSASPPLSSPNPNSLPALPATLGSDLPRRQFLLQNVASGGYATALALPAHDDSPNVLISADAASATRWTFQHQTADAQWAPRAELFSIVARTPAHLAALAHERPGAPVHARFASLRPQDDPAQSWHVRPEHTWRVLPRENGAFVFASAASGALLCQAQRAGPLATAGAADAHNAGCQWTLVDALSGAVCRVLYDSTLSLVPPKLAGPPAGALPTPAAGQQRFLRTKAAGEGVLRQFVEGLSYEHETIRGMLRAGYTSLVITPLVIRGWKNGKVHEAAVGVRDEADVLGVQRFRGQGVYNFEKCERRS